MAFTKQNSIQDILNSPAIGGYIPFFFPADLLHFVPKEMWTSTLEEVGQTVHMPWGPLFGADELVHAANTIQEIFSYLEKYAFVPLWGGEREGYLPDYGANNKEAVCLMTIRQEAAGPKRPAAIICPGGGYSTLARDNEGCTTALKLEEAGYRTFVLNYRVTPNHYPEPQKDLALAVKYVRANRERYGIDPNRVMVMGFSAGGHLCGSFAAHHEEIEKAVMEDLEKDHSALHERYRGISVRPDMVCLSYPVVSFLKESHGDSFQALTGGDESLRVKLSIELQVDGDYPKTFVWACQDDELVPVSNAVRMGEALKAAGVPSELIIYPTGGHGCGTAEGTSAEPWMSEMLKFMNEK